MDVLNTYGGGVDYASAGVFVALGIFALIAIANAVKKIRRHDTADAAGPLLFAAVLVVLAVLLSAYPTPVPVRHEVKLRPGGVIDARKYNVIEQRGKIYVIEERKHNAK